MSLVDYGPSWDYLEGRAVSIPSKVFLDILKLPKAVDQYAEWIRIVSYAVDFAINNLVRNKNLHTNTGEDVLTTSIVDNLSAMNFDARFESNVGGNCDISIYHADGFVWLGEAKIYKHSGNVFGGYRQLVDRYSAGVPNQNKGALILYIKQPNALRIMTEWRRRLIAKLKDIACTDIENGQLEFESELPHSSGLTIRTRHLPVVLFHKPTDTLSPSMRASGHLPIGLNR